MGQMSKSFITAHHEAAHAIVNYRICGHAGGPVSIVADSERGYLGYASDAISDSFNHEHMEARILSCYAGGHAQRRLDRKAGNEGCDVDDEIAADLLRRYGWENREQAFRDRAADLVNEHWAQIAAVAAALLENHVLDDTEIEMVADIVAGEATPEDLARYRLLKGGA
jgi:ATP-dependent Zn protease